MTAEVKSASEILGEFLRGIPPTKKRIWSAVKSNLFKSPSFQDLRAVHLILGEFDRHGEIPEELDEVLERVMKIAREDSKSDFRIKALDILRQQGLNASSPQTIVRIYSTLWDLLSKEEDQEIVRFAGFSLIYLWARWLTRLIDLQLETKNYLEEERNLVSGDPLLKNGEIIKKWENYVQKKAQDYVYYATLLAIIDYYPQESNNAARLFEILKEQVKQREFTSFDRFLIQRLKQFKLGRWTEDDRRDALMENPSGREPLIYKEKSQEVKESRTFRETLGGHKKDRKRQGQFHYKPS